MPSKLREGPKGSSLPTMRILPIVQPQQILPVVIPIRRSHHDMDMRLHRHARTRPGQPQIDG
jgi:hypothetical protein